MSMPSATVLQSRPLFLTAIIHLPVAGLNIMAYPPGVVQLAATDAALACQLLAEDTIRTQGLNPLTLDDELQLWPGHMRAHDHRAMWIELPACSQADVARKIEGSAELRPAVCTLE